MGVQVWGCREKFRKAARLICFADRNKATFMSGFHRRRAAIAFLEYLLCCANAGYDLYEDMMASAHIVPLFAFKSFAGYMQMVGIWSDKQAHFFVMCSLYTTMRERGTPHAEALLNAQIIGVGREAWQVVTTQNSLAESAEDQQANMDGLMAGKNLFEEFTTLPGCGAKCLVEKCMKSANSYRGP